MDIVDRLQQNVESETYLLPIEYQSAAASEIKWLRAERDMWRKENVKKQQACEDMALRLQKIEWERDLYLRALEKIGVVAAGIKPTTVSKRQELIG